MHFAPKHFTLVVQERFCRTEIPTPPTNSFDRKSDEYEETIIPAGKTHEVHI